MTPPDNETSDENASRASTGMDGSDSGLVSLCAIAAYYRIPADPTQIRHHLAILGKSVEADDLVRAAQLVGLKARVINSLTQGRLDKIPVPAIVHLGTGEFEVFGGRMPSGAYRVVNPVTRVARELPLEEIHAEITAVVLISRRLGGPGANPQFFGIRWFLPSIWRYRRPLAHVLAASFFVQIFALITPLFFQVVIDKVLSHRSYDTLLILVGGIIVVGLFDVILQYLRTYALSHTTNRIDVELGRRLFFHLFHLPLSYFETRSQGCSVLPGSCGFEKGVDVDCGAPSGVFDVIAAFGA